MPARTFSITQSSLVCDDGFQYVVDDRGDKLIFERYGQGFGKSSCSVPRRRKIYSFGNQNYFPQKWEGDGKRIELCLIRKDWQLKAYRILEKITSLSFYGKILKKTLFWVSIPLTIIALWELVDKILQPTQIFCV